MRLTLIAVIALLTGALPAAAPVHAQGTEVAFGAMRQDKDLPVEVSSDTLSVNQDDGTAVFTGNVVIGQGEMRLSAPHVLVVYDEETSEIARLEATGGVVLVSGEDAAEGERADYNVKDGTILMSGDVLLTQGPSSVTSDRMRVDLDAGTAKMEGRVRTVLQRAVDQ